MCFDERELHYLKEAVESQSLWRGETVFRFEDAFSAHIGRKYVLALSSGTCANESIYAGLGLEPGDEIICPGVAPIFVSFPVVSIGCVPVFADVDPLTQIVTAEAIEAAITPRAKAVVVVHLYGQPAQMDEIMAVARKHNLKVIEDCSQSYDAFYKGRKVGTIGDGACFSLQQSKHITTGEGGLIVTDDPEIYKRAMLYANCGMPWYRYDLEKETAEAFDGLPNRGHFAFGHNYRMSELQAAVGLAQLEKITEFNAYRKELVNIIESELGDDDRLRLAHVYTDTVPNYWSYPVWGPASWGKAGELNYVEFAYRQMQETRRTSLGIQLPDYVQYKPGICPQAEASIVGAEGLGVHHTVSVEGVKEQIENMKSRLEKNE